MRIWDFRGGAVLRRAALLQQRAPPLLGVAPAAQSGVLTPRRHWVEGALYTSDLCPSYFLHATTKFIQNRQLLPQSHAGSVVQVSFTALTSLDALGALSVLPLKRLTLRCVGAELRCAKGLALGLAHARWEGLEGGVSWVRRFRPSRGSCANGCVNCVNWVAALQTQPRAFKLDISRLLSPFELDRILSLELWLVSLGGVHWHECADT